MKTDDKKKNPSKLMTKKTGKLTTKKTGSGARHGDSGCHVDETLSS